MYNCEGPKCISACSFFLKSNSTKIRWKQGFLEYSKLFAPKTAKLFRSHRPAVIFYSAVLKNVAVFPKNYLCRNIFFYRGSFIHYVCKIFQNTNISYLLIRTITCAYQGVRNPSFSRNLANFLNEEPSPETWEHVLLFTLNAGKCGNKSFIFKRCGQGFLEGGSYQKRLDLSK